MERALDSFIYTPDTHTVRLYPGPAAFDWNGANKDKNLVLHGVTRQAAEDAFFQPGVVFEDHKHSAKERRYGLFGETVKGRRLTIIFIVRHGKVRVISTRDMSRRERGGR